LNLCLLEPKQLETLENLDQANFQKIKIVKRLKFILARQLLATKTKPDFQKYKTIQHKEFFIQFKPFLNDLKIGAKRTILLTYFIAHVHAIL
jgi:hypothetical protein